MPRTARPIPWIGQIDSVYYVFWYDAGARRTKRLSLKTSDAEVAQSLFAEFLAEKAAVEGKPPPRVITVAETLDFYVSEHVENNVLAPTRQKCAVAVLKRHMGDVRIDQVDAARCEQYVRERRKDRATGIQDATIRRELSTLRAAANFALARKRIDAAPVFKLPADTAPNPNKWLTREQVQALIDAADGHAKKFIQLAYWTGARKGVLHQLKKQQINFAAGHIDLHPPGRPRSKKRNPVIKIPNAIREQLAEWMIETPNEYVLGSSKEPRRGFAAAVKRAKLDHLDVSPHWLRHSRASHMLQAGVPPFKVARFLGDTLATVDRVYGHMAPDDIGDV
jgi:integrase